MREASRAPSIAPAICAAPIAMPKSHSGWPTSANAPSPPRFEAKFSSLVWAVAFRTPYPASVTNPIM